MIGISNASQLRVLHTADLHLDRQFSSWGDAASVRQQDLLDTLDKIGTLAREHQVQLVLLAGDQFDRHNPGANAVSRFRGWLDQLGRDGIQVVLISGNHDSFWYEDSIYRQSFPSNTLIFKEPVCETPLQLDVSGMTVSLYGIAHDHTQARDVLPGFQRRTDDGVHIGLLHATVDARPDLDIQPRYLPLNSHDLASTGLDYVALGHLHRARTINDGGPGMAAYPGSPEPLDITETGPRSVSVLSFNGGAPRLETVACGCRTARREQIDATNLTSDQIAERIAAFAGDDAIVNAVLTGAPHELPDPESLQQRLTNRFCYLSVKDETSVVDTGFVQTIEGERTIRGQFVQRLRERVEQAESEREREKAALALRLGLVALQKRSAR